MERLTQNINFRVSPETKASLVQTAENKGMSLSEYLNMVVLDYERVVKELAEANKTSIQSATSIVMAYTQERENELRKEILNEYIDKYSRDSNETIKQLKAELDELNTPEFDELYQQMKGKVVNEDSKSRKKRTTIKSRSDVLNLLVRSFTIKVE